MKDKRNNIPVIALRGMVLLPEMVAHFDIARPKSIAAIEKAMKGDQKAFFLAQKTPHIEETVKDDVYQYGCMADIKQIVRLPKGVLRVLVIGRERGIWEELYMDGEFIEADVEIMPDIDSEFQEDTLSDLEDKAAFIQIQNIARMRELKEAFKSYATSVPNVRKNVQKKIDDIRNFTQMVDVVAASCILEFEAMQEILEERNATVRCEILLAAMFDEIEIATIREGIHKKVKENMDKSQKEFVLREQMKVIRKELGDDPIMNDIEEFEIAVDTLEADEKIKTRIKKEIKRFRSNQNNSAESSVIRNYIETLIEMPWNKRTEDSCNLTTAKKILDKEHYGLDEVKERILEYLAVRTLANKSTSPILCLVGPPGTGKTSIAKSLADAMNKKYVRISLGGIHDEAEIRGHRRTYIGAMPGRIAHGIKQAGTKNPLMLLDEIDKVGQGNKGDTFSALLEVLDNEQNIKFRDHYLDMPLDLSEVLFVATANSLQTIPRPLLDRMEIIEVHSYTENEKAHIAKRHLIPKQMEMHGLTSKELTISKVAIENIARHYTKEAGVRQLERKIAAICRKVAKEIVETKKAKIRITESNLEKYLGQEKFRFQMRNKRDEVGIVRGLAWTSVGGDTLSIEVNVMPGKGELSLTGQLGNVMKESAAAAISYIRSIGNEYDIKDDYFSKTDIHVHIPEGAVPKDGPSAGITMATAILSAIIGKPVRADVAMTGEITLRGRVLPIGGLKEKLLAAKNAGIKTVLVPVDNQRDVLKIANEITDGLEIISVDHMNKVCEIAFAN